MTYVSYKPQVGDTVTFNGYIMPQVRWGNNTEPTMLKVGEQYVVDKVVVRKSYTKVFLEGFVGDFNSVHFTPVDK